MRNRVTLDQLDGMAVQQVADLPVEQLAMLLEDVAAEKARVKRLDDRLHAAMKQRFGEPADTARQRAGKMTGTVRLDVDGHEVIADLPKKVTWDQAKLSHAVATLRNDWNEDPAEYVETIVKVSETKFNSWPSAIADLFKPARTVGVGKPTFDIKRKEAA